MVLLALGLLAVAVSEVRAVFRARRSQKTPQTAWRQPSEIKAALAAARQAEHEPQPKLPERAAPKLLDGAEFAVYSIGTLLSRIPFLLFALLMVWSGGEFGWRRCCLPHGGWRTVGIRCARYVTACRKTY